MIRVFKSVTHKKGLLGELLVKRKLEKLGFVSRETNFSCKTGEIDLIMQKGSCIYYIEVKSIYIMYSPHRYAQYEYPEHNVSQKKVRRLLKTIEYYALTSKDISMYSNPHAIYIAFVIINKSSKEYCVRFTGNIM